MLDTDKFKPNFSLTRYGEIISEGSNREIVMLRGTGCFDAHSAFCDYHLDKGDNMRENYAFNKQILNKVNGNHNELELICSGNVQELDFATITYLRYICDKFSIKKLSLECYWHYKNTLKTYIDFFAPIEVKFRIGVESFDEHWREDLMNKGMGSIKPKEIAKHFNYCNLIVGESRQTKEQITQDISIARQCFERVCIRILDVNSAKTRTSPTIVEWFIEEIAPQLKNDPKFHILLSNSDLSLANGCMTTL